MNIVLSINGLSADERKQLREIEKKRQRDERERRIAAQVWRIEQEVKALRGLLGGQEEEDGGDDHPHVG